MTMPLDSQDSTFGLSDQGDLWGRLIPSGDRMTQEVFECSQPEIHIGRIESMDIQIPEPQISSRHCTLSVEYLDNGDKKIILQDLSSNGTYVNKKKIGKGNSCLISDGDEIVLISKSKKPDKTIKKQRNQISYMFYIVNDGQDENNLESKYDIKKELGKGSFAVVYLGIDRKTGEKYAIKKISKSEFSNKSKTKKPESIKNEIKILEELKHENIIGIRETFEDDEYISLVLEMAHGGELFDRILDLKKLPERICQYIIKQLTRAISYLHNKNVAHRDLKPENVLMESKDMKNWNVKITDFGLSRALGINNEVLTTICGTPLFLAPEILKFKNNKNTINGYGFEVDWWSLGVLLYVMLVGHPPYNDNNGDLLKLVENAQIEFPKTSWSKVTPQAKHLVTKLMDPNPDTRFKGKQIMQHEWMKMDLKDTSKYLRSNNKRSHYSQKTQIMSQNTNIKRNYKDKMSLLSHNTTDVPMKSNTVVGRRKRNFNEMNFELPEVKENEIYDNEDVDMQPNAKKRRLNHMKKQNYNNNNYRNNNNNRNRNQTRNKNGNRHKKPMILKKNTNYMSIDTVNTVIGNNNNNNNNNNLFEFYNTPPEEFEDSQNSQNSQNSQPSSYTPIDSLNWKGESDILTPEFKRKSKKKKRNKNGCILQNGKNVMPKDMSLD